MVSSGTGMGTASPPLLPPYPGARVGTPGLPACSLSPSVAAWDRGWGSPGGASDSACERRDFDLRPQGREGSPGRMVTGGTAHTELRGTGVLRS